MDQPPPASPSDAELAAALRRAPPMNFAEAYAVMERHGLAGMVLAEPINVYHATGFWPQIARTRVGQPPLTFVLLSADPRQPPGLVTSRFGYYYTYADGAFEQELQVFLFEAAGDEAGSESGGFAAAHASAYGFDDRGAAPIDPVESLRAEYLRKALDRHGIARDSGAALVLAMREMGLWQGRIAIDHPVTAAVCERHEHPGIMIEGDNILREIRMVKSPLEIDLMRRASRANIAAGHAVATAMRAGAGYAELGRLFAMEAAARGNTPVFLNVDRVSSPLSQATIREGQAVFIDAVSHFHNYHGDYGRTIFVGEPGSEVRRAADAVQLGWQAIQETLRPGVRYSEIVATGREAVRKGGFDFSVSFTPHSVGLMHTDEPCRISGGFYVKDDLMLRKDMILSVDCPVLATGLGGSVHLEDLVLIEANGATPIHEVGPAVISV
jgi:Xaa-Pro aminopeptidase